MLRLLMALSCLFSPRVYDAGLPRPRVRTVEWADGRVAAPPPVKGSLRFDLFPYMKEPLDCLDDPEVEVVALQFGSRLGKTTGVQAWLLNKVKHDPHNAIWGEPDDGSLRRVFRRTWQMIDGTPELAEAALPRHLRSNAELRFQDCLIHGAYSGSPATAADLAAPLGAVLNECDKYSHRRRLDADGEDAGEADFADLLIERTKGCPGSKVIFISTPTVKGRSRIEAERLRGDRRRFYVPCTFCNAFQVLKTGRARDEVGGIKWTGKTPEAARDTAWYECEACRKKILDEHRYGMINDGRWVKEGQRIDRRGRLTGKPLVASNRRATFGPLGTHYSLLFDVTWGRIAAKFLEAVRDPLKKGLRNFVNSWEGDVWDPVPVTVQPHEIAERLGVDEPLRTVPEWARFLTAGCDVGQVGEDYVYFWWLSAWGQFGRGQLVDYGITWGTPEFYRVIREEMVYGNMRPVRGGLDSGSFTEAMYQVVAPLRAMGWFPLKGSSKDTERPFATAGDNEIGMYRMGFQTAGVSSKQLARKHRLQLADLVIPSTKRSQEWLEERLRGIVKADDPARYTIPMECFLAEPVPGVNLAEQLLGDYEDEHGRWRKKGDQEFRDACRYARVAAAHYTAGDQMWNTEMARVAGAATPPRQDEGDEARGFTRRRLERRGFTRR